jgi:hypothetical protein
LQRFKEVGIFRESCPVADFGINGVEPSSSATRELVNPTIPCPNGFLVEKSQVPF